MTLEHRHLREIDCLSAIVGGPASAWAMALNPGANQYTGPAFSTKACFLVAGDITTSVNKGRQAGDITTSVNEQSIYLDVYARVQQFLLRLRLWLMALITAQEKCLSIVDCCFLTQQQTNERVRAQREREIPSPNNI